MSANETELPEEGESSQEINLEEQVRFFGAVATISTMLLSVLATSVLFHQFLFGSIGFWSPPFSIVPLYTFWFGLIGVSLGVFGVVGMVALIAVLVFEGGTE